MPVCDRSVFLSSSDTYVHWCYLFIMLPGCSVWDPYFKHVGIVPLFSMVEFFRSSLQPCLSDTNHVQLLAPRVKRILLSLFLHTWGSVRCCWKKNDTGPGKYSPRLRAKLEVLHLKAEEVIKFFFFFKLEHS